MANSKITLNMSAIRNLDRATTRALEKTAEALHTEIVQAQVVPRMDGALQGEKMYVDTSRSSAGEVSIVHEGPYARPLYHHPEYDFKHGPWEETIHHKDGTVSHLTHDGNPNAKGHWFEDWEPGGKHEDFAKKAFSKFLEMEL
nr:MAG TPA: Minor capsid protein [Caudoviricetes sp.]